MIYLFAGIQTKIGKLKDIHIKIFNNKELSRKKI